MALLSINKRWRIKSDERCWIVQRYKTTLKSGAHAGEEVWESVAYHTSLGKAANALAQYELRCSGAEGLQAIMDEWERITQEIDQALLWGEKAVDHARSNCST